MFKIIESLKNNITDKNISDCVYNHILKNTKSWYYIETENRSVISGLVSNDNGKKLKIIIDRCIKSSDMFYSRNTVEWLNCFIACISSNIKIERCD